MRKLVRLPRRLKAIADYIEQGAAVADIGTDHGLIPVYLAQLGVARSIIASDMSEGSLGAARRNADKYGVTGKITFITAPGLDGIGETDADTIIISGMGGETISGILGGAPWTANRGVRLVLQPQTKIDNLRDFLHDNGYNITETATALDRGRIYTIILAEGNDR